MRRKGLSTASVCGERFSQAVIRVQIHHHLVPRGEVTETEAQRGKTRHGTHLGLYVREVDAQLLQQRGLALVALRGEGRDPARPQAALLAHAPGDPRGGRAEAVVSGAGRCPIAAI